MKISYTDSESCDIIAEKTLRDQLKLKDERITVLATLYNEMRGRINVFIAEVDSVRFRIDEAQAEPWMERWPAYLLNGREPAAK